MIQNLSDQFVFPSPKVLDFNEKMLYWASVVPASNYIYKWKMGKNFVAFSEYPTFITIK
jgi:hypothetical protein